MKNRSYEPKDFYYHKARNAGLRARSAFKLEEIARKSRLFRPGDAVLDLGAAPGGFLQIVAGEVGAAGCVVGIDLVPVRPLAPNVSTAVLDVLADDFLTRLAELHQKPFDVVISDLAPKTSGVRSADEARSIRLARRALEVAAACLKPQGAFVVKLFMGAEFEAYRSEVRRLFGQVKVIRPKATRGGSVELYLLGLLRRG